MGTNGIGRIYWMGYSQYQTQLNKGTIKPGYTITTTNLWVPEDFKIQPDGGLEPVNKQERARKRSIESILPVGEREKARERFTSEALANQRWYVKRRA